MGIILELDSDDIQHMLATINESESHIWSMCNSCERIKKKLNEAIHKWEVDNKELDLRRSKSS